MAVELKEHCPKCNKQMLRVVDSRAKRISMPFAATKITARARRKRCGYCDHRFNTIELPALYFKELEKYKVKFVDAVSKSLDMVI